LQGLKREEAPAGRGRARIARLCASFFLGDGDGSKETFVACSGLGAKGSLVLYHAHKKLIFQDLTPGRIYHAHKKLIFQDLTPGRIHPYWDSFTTQGLKERERAGQARVGKGLTADACCLWRRSTPESQNVKPDPYLSYYTKTAKKHRPLRPLGTGAVDGSAISAS